MSIRRVTIITLSLTSLWGGISATEDVDGYRDAGEQLAFECLAGDQQLACFDEKGFTCASVGEPSRRGYSCYTLFEGGCYRTRFQLTTNGWSSSDRWVTGPCEDTHEPVLQPGVRMMFDNINAPDSVLFKQLLHSVFSNAIQSDNDRVSRLFIAPGANAHTDYERVSTYFVSKYYEIEKQIHGEQFSLLCEDDLPRFRDSRLHETFDASDDRRLEIYAEHLAIVRKEFDGDDTFDLSAALSGFPAAFSVHILETVGSVDELYDGAARFCAKPFSLNFTTIEDVE